MKVSSITIYPIKGLGGTGVKTCFVERRGLALDRRWMLVDADGRFISQREAAKMATISVEIGTDCLVVSHSSYEAMEIPFEAGGGVRTVQIWRSSVDAVEVGRDADRWFESVLGVPCSLVKLPDSTIRSTNPDFSNPGDHVSFADGYPVTLATEASLADLNRRLRVPVPMNRFRPNLVIAGDLEPWAEDEWTAVRLGPVAFRVVKPCGRCVVTTVDQSTGISASSEPLTTLATFRNRGSSVDFSVNMIPDNEDTIDLDMDLTVLTTLS